MAASVIFVALTALEKVIFFSSGYFPVSEMESKNAMAKDKCSVGLRGKNKHGNSFDAVYMHVGMFSIQFERKLESPFHLIASQYLCSSFPLFHAHTILNFLQYILQYNYCSFSKNICTVCTIPV